MTGDPDRFPDATRLQLQAEVLRMSADAWRNAYESQKRMYVWLSAPALICAVGVFTLDAPMWVNAAAGATIAGAVAVLLSILAAWRHTYREARTDRAMVQMMFDHNEPENPDEKNRWYPE